MTLSALRPRAWAGFRLALAALALALGIAALTASPALGADPRVALRAGVAQDGSWQLTATVQDAQGAPASGEEVRFAVRQEFMGTPRNVTLGTATTDTSGTATLRYVPSWNGDQAIVASVSAPAGAVGGGVVSGPVTIHVTDAVPAIPDRPGTLDAVGVASLPVAVLVVLAVWGLLLGTFVSAVLGVARPRLRPARARARLLAHPERDPGQP